MRRYIDRQWMLGQRPNIRTQKGIFMLKIRSRIYASVLVCLPILLSGCIGATKEDNWPTISPDLMNQSWLTDIPCRAPCWHGIEPGKTSGSETLEIVKKLPFINSENMITSKRQFPDESEPDGIPGQEVWFSCKEPSNVYCVYMQIKKDVLAWFLVLPNYEITFQQAVDKLGPPDGFISSIQNPEGQIICDVSIIWIDRQIELVHVGEKLGLFEKNLCDLIVQNDNKMIPNLSISRILYQTKKMTEETITKPNYNRWNGFVFNTR